MRKMQYNKKTWKFWVQGIKESSEKAVEVTNELRLNVDEQQDVKTFKVKSDNDESDEV